MASERRLGSCNSPRQMKSDRLLERQTRKWPSVSPEVIFSNQRPRKDICRMLFETHSSKRGDWE